MAAKVMAGIWIAVVLSCAPGAMSSWGSPEMTGRSAFRVEQVAQGLGTPWAMTFLGPDEILFTEREGKIGVLAVETGAVTYLSGEIPRVKGGGQGGMLDAAVPEDYRPGSWIYFTYSRNVGGHGATTLARARKSGHRIADWQDLLVTRSVTGRNIHYGSRIAFDRKGHVYFTVGDRGDRSNSQDLATHAGAILRLHLDGRVPRDNPFRGVSRALPEIYSFGHRNPQGIVFDPVHNRLWAIEHGPRGGDEINLILPGKNYGWPVVSFGKEYWGPVQVGEGTAKKGMTPPVKVYIPSIAPGSLLLYTGVAFPQWQGNLFAGALALTHLNRIILDREGRAVEEERLLSELDARIRALAQSPEGWIYLSTDDGEIYRIRPVD